LNYSYVIPRLPNLSRWRKIYSRHKDLSCLRALEYEKIAELNLSGTILDVGGGDNSLYRRLLPEGIDYHSLNIDPDIKPTFLVEPGKSFPIDDGTYQACLCFNTLEHVYDSKFLLDEIYRALKPGSVVYITVPFIFRIHGHPDDYFRATPSWWRETLHRTGFSKAELQPLIWGRYTSAGSIRGYSGLLGRARFHLAHLMDILYARIAFSPADQRYSGRRGDRISAVALGYFITAWK